MKSDIDILIDSSLEIKRALAVKMCLVGYSTSEISKLLNVSVAFVKKWRALYNKKGAVCFPVCYKGRIGLLTNEQMQNTLEYVKSKSSISLLDIISYIRDTYDIEFKSKQSYYDIMSNAGMSWKKSEKINPKKDEAKVILKKEELKKNSMKEKKKYNPGNWSF
ncbi:MAG: helix-turn-helix domain-containing protein [Paludibacter sp.]|nr:helix-turn-helix domain-containing protein [Paludibacter sp.]